MPMLTENNLQHRIFTISKFLFSYLNLCVCSNNRCRKKTNKCHSSCVQNKIEYEGDMLKRNVHKRKEVVYGGKREEIKSL